jgi:hypothetical protein
MSRSAGRRSEHVKPDRARSDLTQPVEPATGPDGLPAEAEAAPEPLGPRYWFAILLWAVGFGLMIVYEIIAAIWRA